MSKIKYLGLLIIGIVISVVFEEKYYELPEYLGTAISTLGLFGLLGWICIPKK